MARALGFLTLLVACGPVAYLASDVAQLRVTASSDALLLESDPAIYLYNETRSTFGTDEYIILAAEVEDPMSDEALDVLVDLEEQVRACPQVANVLTILTVPLLRSRPGGLIGMAPTYIDNPDAPPVDAADLDLAEKELRGHEFYEKLLISEDWDIVSCFAYLDVPEELELLTLERWELRAALATATDESERARIEQELASRVDPRYDELSSELAVARRELVYSLRGVVDRVAAEHGLRVTMAGVPVINVNMADYVRHDLQVFGLVSLGVALFALVLLLGSFARGLLVLVSAVVPVLVTLLLMVALDVPMTVVTCNLPSLLFVLSLAHGIHLVERWRRLGATEGVTGVARSLFVPCALTATTTMAGFLSLIVTDLRPVIDFGTFMSVGVGLALLSAFWIVPAGLAIGGPPRSKGEEAPRARLAGFLRGLGSLSLAVGPLVLVVAAVLLVVSLGGATRLTAETRFSDYFRDDSEIVTGLEYVDQNLVGVTTMEVVVTAPEGETFLSTWGVDVLSRIEEAALTLPSVSRVESIAGLYREFAKAVPMPADQALPLAFQFEEAKAVGLGYVTEDGREARVVVRLRETDADLDRAATRRALEELLAADEAVMAASPQLTGVFVLHGNLLASLIGNQVKSFFLVSAAILVMFLLIFRSFAAALIGLVPNVLPVLLVVGIMGYAGIALDMVTVMIAAVAMGIGVDAAIHYLYAYRRHVRRGAPSAEAVREAHATVGRPILFAAVTVVAAFGVLVLSEFIPSVYFGFFTALTMAAALAGTLTLIPVLLGLVQPFGEDSRRPTYASELGASR